MKENKVKRAFVDGPIAPDFISASIAKHSGMTGIGAHSIFLGQVRSDEKEGRKVDAIDYTAYVEMAESVFHQIREETFAKFPLHCLHIYHSLGRVAAGQVCLFVFTSSSHRKEAMDACEYLVNRIKAEVPVWGRELFGDETYLWKENN